MTEGFIAQTAQDYGMNIEDVKRIQKAHPNEFYIKLEEFIKNRAK